MKAYHRGTPPSGSIHEEATNSTLTPYMGVFNNLIMYKQDQAQNSLDTIVPDLATEWSWSDDGTKLTFKLRQGVSWHDGKPFTAKDVKCTCKASAKPRCARTRARRGTRISRKSPSTATTKQPFI